MEQRNDFSEMLNLMVQPGFRVENGLIAQVNQAARRLLVEPGTEIRSLLAAGGDEYGEFADGCLYVQLRVGDRLRGAAILRVEGGDIFLLEPETGELNALALAAQQLRGPMSSVMIAADQIAATGQHPEEAGRLNRGLSQLLRIVGNMSDALLFTVMSQPENRNIPRIFDEIFEKAGTLLAEAGLSLQYDGLPEDIWALADGQQLERAVLNILSNAAKFTPPGGSLRASLTRRGNILRLSIQDTGPGIREDILGSIFSRYLRQPGIEDSRFGLGLGMVLIRAAAANHGGAVLIDQPEGARITMTLALRQAPDSRLRSPVFPMDYAGGRDHAMVELSETLPAKLFEKN